ncbi:hypothetical protein DUNSADRAFT_10786 [Dunaliella salina]|uniref:Encoded protein n=1 Tax=Dunaliella salina TaxID=3046 RepID=A0ABQ7H9T1_DUNSA|nr:hypothetical protein DUNSADRAFT_10786 [Dunaliella salina]|eukprot:KAF5843611.1 hypothetical protein DUNSADRAFT_10786 [Dunaliella salina]
MHHISASPVQPPPMPISKTSNWLSQSSASSHASLAVRQLDRRTFLVNIVPHTCKAICAIGLHLPCGPCTLYLVPKKLEPPFSALCPSPAKLSVL